MAFLNELSPWQRKSDYHNNMRIMMAVKDQANFIKSETQEITASYYEKFN